MSEGTQPSCVTDELGYNEFNMIGFTIMRYQPGLLTKREREIADAFWARGKARAYGDDCGEVYFRELWGNLGDPEIEEALEAGYETFAERFTKRVLQTCLDELELNRCMACNRIVGTPYAKWCKWCKFDWH